QDREEFLGITHLLTQRQGPRVGPFHLRGGRSTRGELHAQATLQCEFVSGTGRGPRQRAQEGQGVREVRNRFRVGRTVYSVLASLLPVGNSLLRTTGLRVVMREPGWLLCRQDRKSVV